MVLVAQLFRLFGLVGCKQRVQLACLLLGGHSHCDALAMRPPQEEHYNEFCISDRWCIE